MVKPDLNKAKARVGRMGQGMAPGSVRIQPDASGTVIGLRIATDNDSVVCWANLKPGAARRLAKRLLDYTQSGH